MQREPHPKTGQVFHRSISSDDWYLWDNYGYADGDGIMHIYSQAADKSACATPEDRFSLAYWRHFTSGDEGVTWRDEGPVFSPRDNPDAHDSKTIWSGSVLRRSDGLVVAAYTGLQRGSLALQSMAIALSPDGHSFERLNPDRPLLSPILDYDELCAKGYYLGPRDTIGDTEREEDGTFLCFRDPFLFNDEAGRTHLYFAAKARLKNRVVGALGHALFTDEAQLRTVEILPPQFVPDARDFNLLELPNVFMRDGIYYLVISTSILAYFGQPDLQAQKSVRIYRSTSLNGPWQPYGSAGGHILLKPERRLHGLNVVNGADQGPATITCRAFWVGESWLPPSLLLTVGGRRPELTFPESLWRPDGGGVS
ncbi:MAG: hypothetical protein EA427_11215 [Spirochaetaceae bacterium]|nr:MAG: hypothetical protein EA427_11215 [Spirochaetaceae bacterium]